VPSPSPAPGAPAGTAAVSPEAAAPGAGSRSWEQVRNELGLNPADVDRHRARLEGGSSRLAEVRRHRRVTQRDLAGTLGVSQSRVSQIERQSVDDTVVSTLTGYVEALGASILILADFGEEQFVLRRTPGLSIPGETGTPLPDLQPPPPQLEVLGVTRQRGAPPPLADACRSSIVSGRSYRSTASLLHPLLHRSRHQHEPASRRTPIRTAAISRTKTSDEMSVPGYAPRQGHRHGLMPMRSARRSARRAG
jgi:transcriptional regulator with XRE-family HTH domain